MNEEVRSPVCRLPPPPKVSLAPPLPELPAGEIVDDRYRIEAPIGAGGFGRVYRAVHVKLGRPVAFKVLLNARLGQTGQRPRFEREAIALASLNHPHVVSVQDYGVWRGQPFLVMELLEGQSLRERMDQGALSEREALRITRQLLRALAYAHSKGVVHRDLKPGNIFLQSFPTQADHVKVLDFGFAKFMDNNALGQAPALTRAGTTIGTPAYMSPERLYEGRVDGRADLYALGIILFEMLAGEKPFDGEASEVLRAHLTAAVPLLAQRRPDLGQSPELTQLFHEALQKRPEDRYGDAMTMLAAIDKLPRPATFPLERPAPANTSHAQYTTAQSLRGAGPSLGWSPQALRGHLAQLQARGVNAWHRLQALTLSPAAGARLRALGLRASTRLRRLSGGAQARLRAPGRTSVAGRRTSRLPSRSRD